MLWRWSEAAGARRTNCSLPDAGWYIPERTGVDQGQEVTVTGPSPACAPTDRILDGVRWNTFPHTVPSRGTLGSKCPLVSRTEKRPCARWLTGDLAPPLSSNRTCVHTWKSPIFHSNYNFKSLISHELHYSYKYSAYFFIAHSYMPPSRVLFWIWIQCCINDYLPQESYCAYSSRQSGEIAWLSDPGGAVALAAV